MLLSSLCELLALLLLTLLFDLFIESLDSFNRLIFIGLQCESFLELQY